MGDSLKRNNAEHLLTGVCVLLSAHYSAADLNLTTPEWAFERYRDLQLYVGPFDYRMLPALLWHALSFVLTPLYRAHPGLHLPVLHQPFTSDEGWFLFFLGFFSMLGTLMVARRMLRSINPAWQFEWLALGLGYAAYFDSMLVLNRNLYYPYDTLALFFFTLLVYLAWRGRPVAFCAALAVATLNKETACMAILIYFGFQVNRGNLRRVVAICAGMAVIPLAVHLGEHALIHHVCSGCTGQAQNQLAYNLSQLANPLFWLSESTVFGFGYVALILLWRLVPMRLRVTAGATYVLWLGGMTVVGILREVRIFSELSALLLLLVATGLNQWLLLRARGSGSYRAKAFPAWEQEETA